MTANTSHHPLEAALGIAFRRLIYWGLPMSVLALLFPAPSPASGLLSYATAHLVVLQVATLALTIRLAPLTDQPWFSSLKRPWLASAASLVAIGVGYAALLTLATSAAARYDPSLQFLQLLSSLDIAWVVAALYLGARILWNRGAATTAAGVILLACVASITIYLDQVGFAGSGGWIVDGQAMMTIVLPADMVAAILSVTVLLFGSRTAQATLQARPQSYS